MFRKVFGFVVFPLIAMLSSITIYASNYPAVPYGIIQAGFPRVEIDWENEKWADVFEIKKEVPFTIGIGGLLNPAYTGDWLMSGEINSSVFIKPKNETETWKGYFSEPMIFGLAKVTIPTAENHDWFLGIGFGLMIVNDKKCIPLVSELGSNWHINNGLYARLTLRYLKPLFGEGAQDKPNTLSVNGGLQYNFL